MNRTWMELVKNDMKPALGVTEPAAIALACATARAMTEEPVESLLVRENSGIYKNAFTCGIPNTEEVGNIWSAALGCIAGNAEKGLLVLEDLSEEDVAESRRFIDEGRVRVEVDSISPELYIYACVRTAHDTCEVEIRKNHTNICRKVKNGRILLDLSGEAGEAEAELSPITGYTLEDFYRFASETPAEELLFLREAYRVNRELAEAAFASDRCTLTKSLLQANGGQKVSKDLRASARVLAGAAAEARFLGLDKPAMSITGSGNHGIICTMPLDALYQVDGMSEEMLLRGTALSYLVTMYMKEYSGKLSAFCGCGIAAGTGMACAMTLMRGGTLVQVEATLNNMAASIVGMICTGGNHACCMKVLAAVDTAVTASELALSGSSVEPQHGVADTSPEKTMQNIGRIASPGMVETEGVILDIMQEKGTGRHHVLSDRMPL